MRLSHVVNVLGALAVLGVLVFGSSDSRASLRLLGAGGAVSLSNSREGAAILNGSRLRPGLRTAGSVTIGNPGSVDTRLALEVGSEGETTGAGGARLWDRLMISISDGSSVVYEGRVADLGRLALGVLTPGARRTYAMRAWVPAGTNDNALQGTRVSLRFTWLADPAETSVPAPPPPAPPPAPPAVPVAPDPAAAVTAEQLFSLPPAKRCLSRRTITIKVRPPKGVKVRSVTSTVNRKKNASAKDAKTKVTLRGLPRGTVKVKLTATLTTGRKLTVTRTYKTCAKRR